MAVHTCSHILPACSICTTNRKKHHAADCFGSTCNCWHVASDGTAEVAGFVLATKVSGSLSLVTAGQSLCDLICCGVAAPSPGGLSEALDPPPAAPATTGTSPGYGGAATPATGMLFYRYALRDTSSSFKRTYFMSHVIVVCFCVCLRTRHMDFSYHGSAITTALRGYVSLRLQSDLAEFRIKLRTCNRALARSTFDPGMRPQSKLAVLLVRQN